MLTDSFGMELYLKFKEIKMKSNKIKIDNIIKIMLPSDTDEALEKLDKDIMQINKDIISRISLAFSTTNRISYYWKDKVAILPEITYQYAREYVTLDKKALKWDK